MLEGSKDNTFRYQTITLKNPPSQKEGRRLREKSEGISFLPNLEEDDLLLLPLKWTK